LDRRRWSLTPAEAAPAASPEVSNTESVPSLQAVVQTTESSIVTCLPAKLTTDDAELADLLQARDVIAGIVTWYGEERLHSVLGCLRPIRSSSSDPAGLHEQRRRKMADARHWRRARNLRQRQPTLPPHPQEGVANQEPKKSHWG
jgi:hypothetical protein